MHVAGFPTLRRGLSPSRTGTSSATPSTFCPRGTAAPVPRRLDGLCPGLRSLRLIFCSRTTAAALLQSLALIHTSDPPDTLSALPQCTSTHKLSQTRLAFYLSLIPPPPKARFLSAGLPTALYRPVSFAPSFSFWNSLNFPLFFPSFHPPACLTKVFPNLPKKMSAPRSTSAGRPARLSQGLSDLHEDRPPRTTQGRGEFWFPLPGSQDSLANGGIRREGSSPHSRHRTR